MNYTIMDRFRCFRFSFLMEGLDLFSGKGGEELYEMPKDPHQWNNLAENTKYAKT